MTVGRKPLDVLLAAVCHGTADRSQMEQLAELLRHDTQAMDEYLRQVDVHVLLATDPALGLASAGKDTGAVRLAKALSRRRRRTVQALSVAVLATTLVLAALVVFERTRDSRERSVVTPVELPFGPTTAAVPSTGVVIEESTVASAGSDLQPAPPSPQAESQSRPAKPTSPPTRTRWSGTPRSNASRTASFERSSFRLLPTRYNVPRSDRLADGRRYTFSVFQTAVSRRADDALPRPETDAQVVKRSAPRRSRSRDVLWPSQRSPLWRRDLDSQLSMNIHSMKLDWRKIDEK